MNTREEREELWRILQESTKNTTSSIMGKWADMNRLEKENAELKEEIQHLKDTACEIMSEGEPEVEPCPVCGGEMGKTKAYGAIHLRNPNDRCPWRISDVEAHNAIARVLKEASSWTEGFPTISYARLRDAMHDLRVLQSKVKGE